MNWKEVQDFSKLNYYDLCANPGYFIGDNRICREERQYALFLYNCFLSCLKGNSSDVDESIVRKCLKLKENEEISITNVIYEFTALRDIFNGLNGEKKQSFNEWLCGRLGAGEIVELLKETKSKRAKIGGKFYIEWNLGGIPMEFFENIVKESNGKYENAVNLYWVRCMMNAKADIVVFYKKDNVPCVAALECKFESKESTYDELYDVLKKEKTEDKCDPSNDLKLKQTDVQQQILALLFPDNCNKSVKIIRFTKNNPTSNQEGEECININDFLYQLKHFVCQYP